MNAKDLIKFAAYIIIAIFFLREFIRNFCLYKKQKGKRELTASIGAALVFISAVLITIMDLVEKFYKM